jgi:hypothetical protein
MTLPVTIVRNAGGLSLNAGIPEDMVNALGMPMVFPDAEAAKHHMNELGIDDETLDAWGVRYEPKRVFRKFEYQDAKKLIKDAKVVNRFSSNAGSNTTYQTADGEYWYEDESKLEAPYDDYTLVWVEKTEKYKDIFPIYSSDFWKPTPTSTPPTILRFSADNKEKP